MAGKSRRPRRSSPSHLARSLRNQINFRTVFREGMALVEAAATYLDGDGRKEARKLQPPHSLAYATESMRLTTRLMQLASWLLIRARGQRRRAHAGAGLRGAAQDQAASHREAISRARDFGALPPRLHELIQESVKLQERVVRLDQMLGTEQAQAPGEADHPLSMQLSRLREAFGKAPIGGD